MAEQNYKSVDAFIANFIDAGAAFNDKAIKSAAAKNNARNEYDQFAKLDLSNMGM